jgi:thiosulfate reductase cytochrome b subunit
MAPRRGAGRGSPATSTGDHRDDDKRGRAVAAALRSGSSVHRAGYALGERGRHGLHDHERLEDLQRLAAVRLQLSGLGDAGGWLGGAIAWHLASMRLLVGNGLIYVGYGLISGHFRRSLLPL